MQLSFNIFKKCKISFSPNGSPNMQRHRCRKDTKKAFHFLGVFTPGSNYAAVFAKYRATLGRKVRLGLGSELAGVWFRGFARRAVLSAVSSTQSLQPAHCTLLRSSDLRRLQTPAMGSLSGTHARPQCRWTFNATFAKKWRSLSDRLIANYGRTLHTTLMFSKNQCLRPGITCYAD